MKIKQYRITCIIAESPVITSPADFEMQSIFIYAYNENAAIDAGIRLIKEKFPGKLILSAEIEPMFN
jgi:hypothetical protein